MLFHQRRFYRRQTSFSSLRVRVLLGLLLLVLSAIGIDYRIRPLITSVSGYQIKTMLTGLINRIVAETLREHSEERYVIPKTGADGGILSMETDTIQLGLLQTEITNRIAADLTAKREETVSVPLGTLLGSAFLSGHGPGIALKIIPIGLVETAVKSQFHAAGINQTLHQLVLEVDCSALTVIPGYSGEVSVHTSYILVETAIIGKIPGTYAQIFSRESAPIEDSS